MRPQENAQTPRPRKQLPKLPDRETTDKPSAILPALRQTHGFKPLQTNVSIEITEYPDDNIQETVSSGKPKLLQRQHRIHESDLGAIPKIKTATSLPIDYLTVDTDQRRPGRDYYAELQRAKRTIFIKGEREQINHTQLVDDKGNIVPGSKKSAPAARVKYPGVNVARSPSGLVPLDTNEYFKFRSRSLEEKVIRDYRYDSSDELNIKTIDSTGGAKVKPITDTDRNSVNNYTSHTLHEQTPVCAPQLNTQTRDAQTFNTQAINLQSTGAVGSQQRHTGEEIELREFDSKRTNSNAVINFATTPQYSKPFRDRIRLKTRTQKSVDSALSDINILTSPESRKTVAFKELPKTLSPKTSLSRNTFTDGHKLGENIIGNRVSNSYGELHIAENKLRPLEPRLPIAIVASKSQNRLNNQSSTETSGLGETVTSGCSSQESIPGYYSVSGIETSLYEDRGIDLWYEDSLDSQDTRTTAKEGNGTLGNTSIDSDNIINHTNERKGSGNLTEVTSIPVVDEVSCQAVVHAAFTSQGTDDVLQATSKQFNRENSEIAEGQMKERVNIQIPTDTFKVRAYKPPPDFIGRDVKKPDSLRVHSVNIGPNFDELFTQSRRLSQQQTVGLKLEQINNEWNKQTRGSSIKSRSSQGSFRSRSGSQRRSRRFLSQKESKWMKWGAQRRASYRRRMEKLEKPEPEIPRASTPVKKARQEGLVFVHPDLENKYISEEDINYINRHKHERLKAYKLIEKSKKKHHHEVHDINRLTTGELATLSRFWEHRVFSRSRYISILLSLATTVIYILSICSSQWVTYPSPDVLASYAHEGLWYKCRPVDNGGRIDEHCGDPTGRVLKIPVTSSTLAVPRNHSNQSTSRHFESGLWENSCMTVPPYSRPPGCPEQLHNWQTGVIGLMIFSAGFGFLAAVLGICGVCTSPLPKKIYYFHSAGEIFFVCALSTTIALVVYAVAISVDGTIESHTYGSGYGLGWGGTAFFFAASFCMSLDDLVRESAQNKCCRYICWRSRSRDEDGSHPV